MQSYAHYRCALFVFKSSPAGKGLVPYGEARVSDHLTATKSVENKQSNLTVKESYGKLFFWLIMIGMFLNGVINTRALSNFPAAIQEMHTPAVSTNIISIYSFVGIFGKLILGWINDKFVIIASSIFGCAVFLIAFVLMFFGQNITIMYLMAFSFGLGTPIGTVSPPLIAVSVFGQNNYPKAYGLVNSITAFTLISWLGAYASSRKNFL